MCGIVGYTGKRPARKVLVDGLRALEYRGYDSAGVAFGGERIAVYKCGGRVDTLADILPRTTAHTGIGHTRWATHGAPCAENAHPHLSFDKRIALVHNGVIENHEELRRELCARGIPLASQTDSELVAHLLALETGDIPERIFKVAKRTEGALTLLVLRAGEDKVYCYRRGAALLVAEGEGECFAASDMAALSPYARQVRVLRDGECAVLSPSGAMYLTESGICGEGKMLIPPPAPARTSKCHMADEIAQIPDALSCTLDSYMHSFPARERTVEKLRTCRNVLLVGCGTAWHACLYGQEVIEKLAGKPCRALSAGEVDSPRFTDGDTFAVFVTQSGETADTLRAMEECRKLGAYTLAVTNTEGSTAALAADACFLLRAGAEIAVAATKSYCCQLFALWLLAKDAEGISDGKEEAEELLAKCRAVMKAELPAECARAQKLFFIGKGQDGVTAKEGALKFKEVTCRPADAYSAGELKHGAIALADGDSAAVVVATVPCDARRIRATVSELRSRGTKVYALSTVGDVGADFTLPLPVQDECALAPVLAVIPLQRLALTAALGLGLDPDKPRNLAKSVTVI